MTNQLHARDISTNETDWHGTCRASSGRPSAYFSQIYSPESVKGELCAVQEVDAYRLDGNKNQHVAQAYSTSRCRKIMHWMFYAIPFSSGMTTPVAGALNLQARETCGSVFFAIGMTYTLNVLVFGLWAHYTSKATLSDNWHSVGYYVFEKPLLRWVCLLGGVLGATQHVILSIVSAQGGSSMYTLGCLSGALLTGLVLDSTGLLWARKVKPTVFVVIGVLTVIAGALVHSFPSLRDGTSDADQTTMIVCLIVSMLSGVCMCVQACAGNKLASLIGGFRRAAVWSFFSGALMMYFIGPYIVPGAPLIELLKPKNWWKLTQAPLAAYSLVAVAVCQRKMSGASVYCWFVIGQLLCSTLLDSLGWIGLHKRSIDKFRIIGLLVVLIGVLTVTVSKSISHHQLQSKMASAVPTSSTPRKDYSTFPTPEPARHNSSDTEIGSNRSSSSSFGPYTDHHQV